MQYSIQIFRESCASVCIITFLSGSVYLAGVLRSETVCIN